MTHHEVDVTVVGQKPMTGAKGRRDFKVYQKGFKVKVLKESWKAGRNVLLA